MEASISDAEAIIIIGRSASAGAGWSATLESAHYARHKVRLADVSSWSDIANHAATFDVRVVVPGAVRDAKVCIGSGLGPGAPSNTVALDAWR
jgi:hypothetical protein